MTRRHQTTPPVPLEPSHRRLWRTLWRRCSCGLSAPCVDRRLPAPPLPFPPRDDGAAHRESAWGDLGTVAPPALLSGRPSKPFAMWRYDR